MSRLLYDVYREEQIKIKKIIIWLRIGTGGGAVVNAVMNLRVPQNSGDFSTSREPASFSRRTVLRGVSK